jgi:hypothetical protein
VGAARRLLGGDRQGHGEGKPVGWRRQDVSDVVDLSAARRSLRLVVEQLDLLDRRPVPSRVDSRARPELAEISRGLLYTRPPAAPHERYMNMIDDWSDSGLTPS